MIVSICPDAPRVPSIIQGRGSRGCADAGTAFARVAGHRSEHVRRVRAETGGGLADVVVRRLPCCQVLLVRLCVCVHACTHACIRTCADGGFHTCWHVREALPWFPCVVVLVSSSSVCVCVRVCVCVITFTNVFMRSGFATWSTSEWRGGAKVSLPQPFVRMLVGPCM